MAAVITAEDRRFFQEEGYLIKRDIFTPREVAALQATVEQIKRDGLLYDQATGELQNYQLHGICDTSKLLRALPWQPRVKALVTALLGGEADPLEVFADHMTYQPARTGQGTRWHQVRA